jgi:hypothetical protein
LNEEIMSLETLTSSQALRKWSGLWTCQVGIATAESAWTGTAAQDMLAALRDVSLEKFVEFYTHRVFGFDSPLTDPNLQTVGLELQYVLPKYARELIVGRHSYEKVKAIMQNFNAGKNTGNLIEFCQSLSSLKQISSVDKTEKVTLLTQQYEVAANKQIDAWLAKKEYDKFDVLHSKFIKAREGCETGKCDDCPWLLLNQDDAISSELRDYSNIQAGAVLDKRVAEALCVIIPSTNERRGLVQAIKDTVTDIVENQKHVLETLALNFIGQTLMKTSRPKTFEKDLVATVAHCKTKYGLSVMSYPKFVAQLYKEACAGFKFKSDADAGPTAKSSSSSSGPTVATAIDLERVDTEPLSKKRKLLLPKFEF